MSEADAAERTESPSQRRLDEARRRGQVPRSRDLSAAAVTLAAGLGLQAMGGYVGGHLLGLMRASLSLTRAEALDPGQMLPAFGGAALQALIGIVPLLGLLLAAACLAPLAVGGWTFSTEALVPDWERLDPIAGMQRVFSIRGTIELLKALLRFSVVAVVAVLVLRHQFTQYAMLGVEPVRAGIAHSLSLCGSALIALGGSLALIALVDVPIALWQHHRSLRMTREELRQEAKETEGSPEVRGRIRRTQQDMARKRMMQEVPTADVVVTNPTHFAVALKYDDARMRAPTVVAKGRDLVALRIRELAAAHRVPVVESPPLARALHRNCELGDEIPARLYAAVAQILTYVYQLRHAKRLGHKAPSVPAVTVPEDPL